ncbi:MAG: hypothetical protein Ta2B_10700 [Termitinemataceae bacterium]|nr:MAG: hypothetical protein Ta2B_10700 [Termitinemataceae bacterium]
MKKNLTGIPPGFWYFDANDNRVRHYSKGEIPERLYCYQAVFCAYANADVGMASNLADTRFKAMQWFKAGGTFELANKIASRKFETDIVKGEQGDIIFMGNDGNMNGHAVLLDSIESISDTKVVINTYGAYSNTGRIGHERMTFKKENGVWISDHADANYIFRGYGQINKEE